MTKETSAIIALKEKIMLNVLEKLDEIMSGERKYTSNDIDEIIKIIGILNSIEGYDTKIMIEGYETKLMSNRDIDLLGDKLIKRLRLVGAI